MITRVVLAKLSPTMEEGTLAKWLVKIGDSVRSGDVIAEIETDKATMEVEAVDEGVLGKILVPDGTENVAVNTPIGVIVAEGESADAAPVAAPAPVAQAAAPAPVAASVPATVASAPAVAEIPAGTPMVMTTVREALRDAMAEEMRRDGDVFVMGEEVAEYQGAYKITQGLLQEFGLSSSS